MKKVLGALIIIIVIFAGYAWFFYLRNGKKTESGPPPVALKVGRHSAAFNQQQQAVLESYYGLSEGLVSWDTSIVNKYVVSLATALDSFNIDELKKDTVGPIYESALDPLNNAKASLQTMKQASSLDDKRRAYADFSENLRLVFTVAPPDTGIIYWQQCPMAFEGNVSAGWLSKTEARRNPYLGTKHPKYKDSMLECGEMQFRIQTDTSGRK